MRSVFFGRFYHVAYLLFLLIPYQAFASANSFDAFYRYPAEERAWLAMGTDPATGRPTAYFRDAFVGGQTSIAGASDGETWSASMLKADGTTTNWSTLKFAASYNGQSNCFYGLGWTQCGGTSIQIIWYLLSQCGKEGNWAMSFTNNGSTISSHSFTILPQIPPGKVPDFKQADYPDVYDHICYVLRNPLDPRSKVLVPCATPGAQPYTIADKGCFLSDVANIFSYHRLSVTPSSLNTALNQTLGGYNEKGNVLGDTAADIAKANGVAMTYTKSYPADLASLRTAVCKYGPQMVGIKDRNGTGNGHWLTATGVDQASQTILVNDPGSSVAPRGIPAADITGARQFAGPEYNFSDRSGFVAYFHSPGELLLTNPAGQRTGLDPLTNTRYNEIPGSFYEPISLDDATTGQSGPETKELDVRMPLEGEYVMTVTGTGIGTYVLEMFPFDINGTMFPTMFKVRDVPLSIGSIQSYAFNYSKNPASPTEFMGGFDGGGQRPRDVNKFLSYSSPSTSRTALPSGTAVFPLLIFYGKATVASTFKAILNGVDISAQFSPVAGGFQTVNLNLQRGSNVLKTSIDGSAGTRTATDSDRLVFDVP